MRLHRGLFILYFLDLDLGPIAGIARKAPLLTKEGWPKAGVVLLCSPIFKLPSALADVAF